MRAWVVSADMGYGHQRAAYPLKDIAYEKIITANSDKMISPDEQRMWDGSRNFYEFISRTKQLPVIGKSIFGIFDLWQSISPLYPFRDLSKPNIQTLILKHFVNRGLCNGLIKYVKQKDIPFVATFPFPAVAAYYLGLKKVFLVVTDSDVNRAWVIDNPKKNNITYFIPTVHTGVRLREYGVMEKNIIFTGFPLPKENIGPNQSILKKDLAARLQILDPNNVFIKSHREVISKNLGKLMKPKRPLTISFAVGGAGAEAEIGIKLVSAMKELILKKKIKINLVAGTRLDILEFFKTKLQHLDLADNTLVDIIFALNKKDYFTSFNQSLRTTDILWTKPSELTFYIGLGLPIITAPAIGAHEKFNQEWLFHTGAGFLQEKPEYAADWISYWLQDGRLAEAAWHGWVKAPTLGTYKIEQALK